MAKKNKSKSISFFWVIIIAVGVVIYYFYSNPEKKMPYINKYVDIDNISKKIKDTVFKDISSQTNKIDRTLINTLINLNVQDHNVEEEYREEKKSGIKTWVQVNRKVTITDGKALEDYQLVITQEMSKLGAHVVGEIKKNDENEKELLLTVSLDDLVIEKLTLIQKKN